MTKIKNKVFLSLAHTALWDSCFHLSAFFMSPFMKQIFNNSNMAAARAIRAAWNMSSLRGTNHLIIQKCNIKDVLSCFFLLSGNKLILSTLGSRVRAASTIHASQILSDSIPTQSEVVKPGDIGKEAIECSYWSWSFC